MLIVGFDGSDYHTLRCYKKDDVRCWFIPEGMNPIIRLTSDGDSDGKKKGLFKAGFFKSNKEVKINTRNSFANYDRHNNEIGYSNGIAYLTEDRFARITCMPNVYKEEILKKKETIFSVSLIMSAIRIGNLNEREVFLERKDFREDFDIKVSSCGEITDIYKKGNKDSDHRKVKDEFEEYQIIFDLISRSFNLPLVLK